MNKGVVSGCCLDVDRLLALARTTGPTGPTGPTGRLFKSSNKIIIDSSLIIPYNEKKDNILHNIS